MVTNGQMPPSSDAEPHRVSPLDMINPNITKMSKEEAAPRLAECLNCEHLIKLTTSCRKCGCFMKAKTRLPLASCPIGKW
jgi:hypothetical protein